MTVEPNYKATMVILNDIESHGLIQFNKEYLDEGFFRNFFQFKKAFSHTMSELINNLDTFQTKKGEVSIFITYSELSYINSHLELIKKFLKIIINPIKLDEGFGKHTTLEQMINRICEKMSYPEKLCNSIKGLFLLNFANAITQQQYRIHKSGEIIIYPKNEKMKMQLNIKDLADSVIQSTEILDAMLDWANGKTKNEDEKTKDLDHMVNDLTNQIKKLDIKLDSLS